MIFKLIFIPTKWLTNLGEHWWISKWEEPITAVLWCNEISGVCHRRRADAAHAAGTWQGLFMDVYWFVTGIFKWFSPLWGINGHRTSQHLCLLLWLGQVQTDTKLMIRVCKRKWRCTSSEPVSPTQKKEKRNASGWKTSPSMSTSEPVCLFILNDQ